MNVKTVVAIAFIVVGGLGIAYGGFSYTKDSHDAEIGLLHLSLQEKQYVNVPMWAGIGALLIGGLMLTFTRIYPNQ